MLCRCLRLGKLVCPQLEHPCEPWCFAVLVALCPLASLCARSWNTLVSLGALRFGKLVCLSHWNILVSLGVLLWLLLLFHRIFAFPTWNLLAAQDGSATNKLGHHTT